MSVQAMTELFTFKYFAISARNMYFHSRLNVAVFLIEAHISRPKSADFKSSVWVGDVLTSHWTHHVAQMPRAKKKWKEEVREAPAAAEEEGEALLARALLAARCCSLAFVPPGSMNREVRVG